MKITEKNILFLSFKLLLFLFFYPSLTLLPYLLRILNCYFGGLSYNKYQCGVTEVVISLYFMVMVL